MARVNLPVTVFFAGAAIFCAAGWTSESLAAFVSHNADAASDYGTNGTAIGALPGSAPSAASTGSSRFTMTGNGMPSSMTAPMLAAPIGFERSSKRVRELDSADPWSTDHQLRSAPRKKMELESSDPWNPTLVAAARPSPSHRQLMLDESDPWTEIPPEM